MSIYYSNELSWYIATYLSEKAWILLHITALQRFRNEPLNENKSLEICEICSFKALCDCQIEYETTLDNESRGFAVWF